MSAAEKLLPKLLAIVRANSQIDIRRSAVTALEKVAPKHPEAHAALREIAVIDPTGDLNRTHIWLSATDALRRLKQIDEDTVKGLIPILTSKDKWVRQRTAELFGTITGHDGLVIRAIHAALKKERYDYAQRAQIEALARFGPASAEAVPKIESLATKHGPTVTQALKAINRPPR